jgi:dolichol-phosphate mannosyltransferase
MAFPVRFVKFCIVGFSGAIVDMTVFWMLCEVVRWPVAPAKCVSTEAAILNNFFWNDVWTFADLAASDPKPRLRRFATFNAICAGGLVFSLLLLFVQVAVLGLNRYLANGVAIVLVTAWNFGMNRAVSWATPTPAAAVERTA